MRVVRPHVSPPSAAKQRLLPTRISYKVWLFLVWFGLVLPRARGQSSRIMGRPPFAPPRLEIDVRAISAEKAGWLGGLGRKGGSDD